LQQQLKKLLLREHSAKKQPENYTKYIFKIGFLRAFPFAKRAANMLSLS